MVCMRESPGDFPGKVRRDDSSALWRPQLPRGPKDRDGSTVETDRYDGSSIPNTRQIKALPVAMKKSSVPRGENSSMSVFAAAMITATAIQAGGMPWLMTTHRHNASAPAKPDTVPPIDLRFTSPM